MFNIPSKFRSCAVVIISFLLTIGMGWCSINFVSNAVSTEETQTVRDTTSTDTASTRQVPEEYSYTAPVELELKYEDIVQEVIKEIAINTIKESSLPNTVKATAVKELLKKLEDFPVMYSLDEEISQLIERTKSYRINYEVLDTMNYSEFRRDESYRIKISSVLVQK